MSRPASIYDFSRVRAKGGAGVLPAGKSLRSESQRSLLSHVSAFGEVLSKDSPWLDHSFPVVETNASLPPYPRAVRRFSLSKSCSSSAPDHPDQQLCPSTADHRRAFWYCTLTQEMDSAVPKLWVILVAIRMPLGSSDSQA